MKTTNKILPIMVTTILLVAPYYVKAEEPIETPSEPPVVETDPTPTPGTTPDPIETPIEKKIVLDKSEIDLDSGKTTTLTATTTPADAEIEWSSDNEAIATVDTNGKVTAGTSAGTTTIRAIIKGTDKEAVCIVNVSRTIGKDATLKNLTIYNGTLDKAFKSDVYEYSVSVDSNTSKLEFTYELSDSYATYFGPSNNKNLKNGDKLELKIVAEDGTTNRTYTLTIIKDTTSLNLKSLKINGYALNETFDPNTLAYTADIPYEVDTITVQAAAEDSDAKVSVSGVTNLKVGKNTVTVTVQDESGNTRKYEITVTRVTESTIEEKPTSIITSNQNSTSKDSLDTAATATNNNSDDFLKYAIVSLACLILFVIGGIGIYFYIKTSPKRLRKELKEMKEAESSPIVEVNQEQTITENQKNIEAMMTDELSETKEFKVEELPKTNQPENLFDDEEDV